MSLNPTPGLPPQRYMPAGMPPFGSPQGSFALSAPAQPASTVQLGALDQFQRLQTKPLLNAKPGRTFFHLLRHPMVGTRMLRQPSGTSTLNGETFANRLMMYSKISGLLDKAGRQQLQALQKSGVLRNNDTDDQHSTLYHLYSMAVTNRAPGYQAKEILRETIDILHRPYIITQKFGTLSPKSAQQLLQDRQYELQGQGLYKRNPGAPSAPLTWEQLDVKNSATCVASSVMYYMADKEPAELARHLSELTSPMNAFYEKARLDELSPNDPSQAPEILKQQGITFSYADPETLLIKVNIPPSGVIRAIDSQRKSLNHDTQNAIESAYQAALTHLATPTYDPATDMRDADGDPAGSKGLTEPEKTLMQSIIKDHGGVQSVTYQVVANKANPNPDEEGKSFLYGYNRSFEDTAADMLEALKQGEFPIIGMTDMDTDGSNIGGHEITLINAFTDKENGELKFVVADSDDGVPQYVVRTAREIIPRIHHAGLPVKMGRQINAQIEASKSYLIPDQVDADRFNLLPLTHEPLPMTGDALPATPEEPTGAPADSLLPINTPTKNAGFPSAAPLSNIPAQSSPFASAPAWPTPAVRPAY